MEREVKDCVTVRALQQLLGHRQSLQVRVSVPLPACCRWHLMHFTSESCVILVRVDTTLLARLCRQPGRVWHPAGAWCLLG